MRKYKKNLISFVLGCLFGLLLIVLVQINIPLPTYFALPGQAGLSIFDAFLKITNTCDVTDLCRGIGFDGGPLEWLEWVFLYAGMLIGYGIIFLILQILARKISNKLKSKSLHE